MTEQKEKILLVDADQNLLRHLSFYLQQAGYDVVLARNGQEALERAYAEKPVLTILDLLMPDIAGVEVCRRLRKAHLNMYVIILTAMDSTDFHIAGLEAGADDYIAKPVNPNELIARVRGVLRRTNRIDQPPLPNRERGTAILTQNNFYTDVNRKVQTDRLVNHSPAASNQTAAQYLQLASQAAQLQEMQEARELYLQALKVEPDNETALIWLAWNTSDPYEGVNYLEKLVEAHPENPQFKEYLEAGKKRCAELDQLISGSGVLGYWNTAEQIQQERIRMGKDRRSASVQPVGQLLLRKGYITADQLDTAVVVHEMFARLGEKKKLGEILVEYGYLTKEQLQDVLNEQLTDFNTQFY